MHSVFTLAYRKTMGYSKSYGKSISQKEIRKTIRRGTNSENVKEIENPQIIENMKI